MAVCQRIFLKWATETRISLLKKGHCLLFTPFGTVVTMRTDLPRIKNLCSKHCKKTNMPGFLSCYSTKNEKKGHKNNIFIFLLIVLSDNPIWINCRKKSRWRRAVGKCIYRLMHLNPPKKNMVNVKLLGQN